MALTCGNTFCELRQGWTQQDGKGPQLCPSCAQGSTRDGYEGALQAGLRHDPQAQQRALGGLLHGSRPGLPPGAIDLRDEDGCRGLAGRGASVAEGDEWSPVRSRRARVVRSIELFGPYAEEWLAERDIKPRTRSLYRWRLDRFLLPEFGEVSLMDITPQVVRTWHSRLDPPKPTQRAQVYGLLRAILSTAVADEVLGANPCRVKGAGTTRRARRIEPATLAEIEVIPRGDARPAARACPHRRLVRPALRRVDRVEAQGSRSSTRGAEGSSRSRPRQRAGDGGLSEERGWHPERGHPAPPDSLARRTLSRHVAEGRDALLFSSVHDPGVRVYSNTVGGTG